MDFHQEELEDSYLQVLAYSVCKNLFNLAKRPQRCGFSWTVWLANSNHELVYMG